MERGNADRDARRNERQIGNQGNDKPVGRAGGVSPGRSSR
jgi:hypothetical protein